MTSNRTHSTFRSANSSQVGVTSQRAIEDAATEARSSGNSRTLTVRAIITAEGTDLHHVVEGELDLS